MIDADLLPCPLCKSFQVSRCSIGNIVRCNACGCNSPLYNWQSHPRGDTPSDGAIYATVSQRDMTPAERGALELSDWCAKTIEEIEENQRNALINSNRIISD